MTTRRIESLTDGIFAIAMTLLVLNLAIPEAQNTLTPALGLHDLLKGQAHKFFNYALSFILLAIFWMIHHQQFHFIKRTNHTHLWLNISGLMFIALIPFSTSLIDDYRNSGIAQFFFGLNLFIIGIFLRWSWTYATAGYRLVDQNIVPERIALSRRREAVIPLVSLLAIVLSLINPAVSSYIYLLIPIILVHPRFRYK